MKDLLKALCLLMMMAGTAAFAKNPTNPTKVDIQLTMRDGHQSIVSAEDYSRADEFTKRVINYIDASIASLKILDSSVEAKISISKNSADTFSNSIIICKTEKSQSPAEVYKGSCTVCGVSSAYSYLNKIMKDESLGEEFKVHVKRNGDCVTLSW